eukprot:498194-Alexandrium_andersonii.AAC.1
MTGSSAGPACLNTWPVCSTGPGARRTLAESLILWQAHARQGARGLGAEKKEGGRCEKTAPCARCRGPRTPWRRRGTERSTV